MNSESPFAKRQRMTPVGSNNNVDVCRDFLRNVCTRGNKCRFNHPDDKHYNGATNDGTESSSGLQASLSILQVFNDTPNYLIMSLGCRCFLSRFHEQNGVQICGKLQIFARFSGRRRRILEIRVSSATPQRSSNLRT